MPQEMSPQDMLSWPETKAMLAATCEQRGPLLLSYATSGHPRKLAVAEDIVRSKGVGLRSPLFQAALAPGKSEKYRFALLELIDIVDAPLTVAEMQTILESAPALKHQPLVLDEIFEFTRRHPPVGLPAETLDAMKAQAMAHVAQRMFPQPVTDLDSMMDSTAAMVRAFRKSLRKKPC